MGLRSHVRPGRTCRSLAHRQRPISLRPAVCGLFARERLSEMSNLAKIAASLRAGLEADAKDRAAWIERVLERARLLAEARATILSNEVFGQWLDQEKIDINANDRAALLNMARYPELART